MKTLLKCLHGFLFLATAILATAQDGKKEDFVPTGKGWRMIQGTEHRFMPLALAWGVTSDAKDAIQKEEDGSAFTELDERVNFIVHLETGAILGKTEGQHGCDLDHESRRSTGHEAVWSETGDFVVQHETGKRTDALAAWIYHVNDDMSKCSKGAEVLKTACKAVEAKLKGSALFKKTPWADFVVRLHDIHVDRRGSGSVLVLGLDGDGGDEASFDSTATFKLTPPKDGEAPKLTLQSVEIHK